jgi:hypothetical protein
MAASAFDIAEVVRKVKKSQQRKVAYVEMKWCDGSKDRRADHLL